MNDLYEYTEMQFLEQSFPKESEDDWPRKEPGKALTDAVVFKPAGHELSEAAIDTIRHLKDDKVLDFVRNVIVYRV